MAGKIKVDTKDAPAAIGPYSQAVRVNGVLYTSGQIGLLPELGVMAPGGIEEQTERVCENLRAVLAEAGLDFKDVVKTTVYLKHISDFAAMNEIYAKYFAPAGVVAPARSTVEAAALPKDALVEIDVVAVG